MICARSRSRIGCGCEGGGESWDDLLDLLGEIGLESGPWREEDDEEDVASAGYCECCRRSLWGGVVAAVECVEDFVCIELE